MPPLLARAVFVTLACLAGTSAPAADSSPPDRADLAPLIGQLKNAVNPEARAEAARRLGQSAEPEAASALIDALADADRRVRVAASAALDTGGAKAVAQLRLAVVDAKRSAASRAGAAQSLGRAASLDEEETVKALAGALRDDDGKVRLHAAAALAATSGKPDVSGELVALLADPEPGVPEQAQKTLIALAREPFAHLFDALSSDKPDVRRRAAEVFKRLSVPRSLVGKLRELLRTADSSRLPAVAEVVGQLGPPARVAGAELSARLQRETEPAALAAVAEALGRVRYNETRTLQLLRERLKKGDPPVQTAAARALGLLLTDQPSVSYPRVDDVLVTALGDAVNPELQQAAAESLGRMVLPHDEAHREVTDALVKVTTIGDEDVRRAALFALAGRAAKRQGSTQVQAVAALVAVLDDDAEQRLWPAAVEALGRVGPAGRDVFHRPLAALSRGGDDFRRAVLAALANVGLADKYKAPALALLRESLSGGSLPVRMAAIRTLGHLGPAAAEAAPALRAAVRRLADDADRCDGLRALGRLGGDAETRELLRRELDSPQPAVRQAAAEALGQIGPDAITELRDALKSETADTRRLAVAALGVQPVGKQKEVLEALIDALGDATSSGVREAALIALAHEEIRSAIERQALLVRLTSRLLTVLAADRPRLRRHAAALLGESVGASNDATRRAAGLAGSRAWRAAVGGLTAAQLDPDATVVRAAAGSLGTLIRGKKTDADADDKQVREETDLRREAVRALGKVAVQHPDAECRKAAVIGLVDAADRREAAWWLQKFTDGEQDRTVLVAVAHHVSKVEELNGERLRDPLSEALGQGDAEQQRQARLAIFMLADRLPDFAAKLIDGLCRALANEAAGRVRICEALEALGSFAREFASQFPKALTQLTQAGAPLRHLLDGRLDFKNHVQRAALLALWQIEPLHARTLRATMLAVEQPELSDEAEKRLQDARSLAEAVPALAELLRDKQQDAAVLVKSADALRLVGEKARAALDALRALADDPAQPADVREAARRAIEAIGPDPEARGDRQDDDKSGRVSGTWKDWLGVSVFVIGLIVFAYLRHNFGKQLREARQQRSHTEGELREAQRKSSQVEGELAQARDLLLAVFPPPEPLDLPGVRVAHGRRMASEVSGDFYQFLVRPDGKLVVYLVDVEGHGIAAATQARNLHLLLGDKAKSWGLVGSPRELLVEAEQMIQNSPLAEEQAGFCFCCVLIDSLAGTLAFANAGMPFPLLLRPGSNLAQELVARGIYVGQGYDRYSVRPREVVFEFEDGSLLVMVSDGVLEARDGRGEIFGKGRLQDVLIRNRAASPETLVDKILEAVTQHAGGESPQDDQTALVLRLDRRTPATELRAMSKDDDERGEFHLVNRGNTAEQVQIHLQKRLGELAANAGLGPARAVQIFPVVWEALQNATRYGSYTDDVIHLRVRARPESTLEVELTCPLKWPDWANVFGTEVRRRICDGETPNGLLGAITIIWYTDAIEADDEGRRLTFVFGPAVRGRRRMRLPNRTAPSGVQK